ncbi:MAG: hypothetical protein CMQ70_00785 [Gammaproteobacteria bacterium]|nr:hypothetical protein [Gammaproteobacteria bacterium]|tara:strand:- start:32 stop:1963 length:1932 start_codon:yes stop_codon:yes gene_type:complete
MQLIIKKLFLIYFLTFSFLVAGSSGLDRNGITGVWNTPVASTPEAGNFAVAYNYYDPDKRLILNFSPYDFLEVSLVYSSLENQPYVAYGNPNYIFQEQSYKDKAFNVKLKIKDEGKWPAIAIGLNDINGSGIFAGEYIVGSKKFNNFSISSGIGWGTYSGGINFENPLKRNNEIENRAGEFNFDNTFNSDSIGLFSNINYQVNKNINLFAEYDSFNDVTKKLIDHSNLSLGFNYEFNPNFSMKVGTNAGKNFFLQISNTNNFSKFNKRVADVKKLKKDGYDDIRKTLLKNNIGVKEIKNNTNQTKIVLRQNYFQSLNQLDEVVSDTVKTINQKSKNHELEVVYTTLGMKVQEKNLYLSKKSMGKDQIKEYVMNDNFPYVSSSIGLRPRLQIASREGFFHGSLDLGMTGEAIFRENLIASFDLKYSLANNFDEFIYPPVDKFPQQVRSDIKQYLLNYSDGLKIGRLQLDYFHGDNKNFNMISIGYLEEMFSGIVYEYLFFPQRSKIGFGFEINKAYKRDYEMRFNHRDFSNSFNRFNLYYKNDFSRTIWNLSFGEYLAGDEGFTLSIDRYFSNGVKFGVFASSTNVSKQNFGEGSFDKGLNFTIPFSIFSNNNLYRYKWRPFTKDPAQLLIRKNKLIELIEMYR